MFNTFSRNEKLWDKLLKVAQGKKWSYQCKLYSSEIKRIERQWHVEVLRLGEAEKGQISCLISWSNVFQEGINYEQSWYISKLIEEMPSVKTPAQQLYLIAARA